MVGNTCLLSPVPSASGRVQAAPIAVDFGSARFKVRREESKRRAISNAGKAIASRYGVVNRTGAWRPSRNRPFVALPHRPNRPLGAKRTVLYCLRFTPRHDSRHAGQTETMLATWKPCAAPGTVRTAGQRPISAFAAPSVQHSRLGDAHCFTFGRRHPRTASRLCHKRASPRLIAAASADTFSVPPPPPMVASTPEDRKRLWLAAIKPPIYSVSAVPTMVRPLYRVPTSGCLAPQSSAQPSHD